MNVSTANIAYTIGALRIMYVGIQTACISRRGIRVAVCSGKDMRMDRTEAIKWLQRIRTRQTGGRDDYDNARREAIDMACEFLADDALVSVIHCKKCRWYDKGENDSESWQICTRHIGASYTTSDDDYCSMAERSGGKQ